ncbi:MAG: Gfo/Idh/MocA family protein [Candidatus Hodarchaeales archaeon]|jgi:predicted dehydrogenase
MTKVNWGILGVANIARRIAPAIQETPNSQVVAVASRNKDKAKKFAKEYGIIKYYGNYPDLLKDNDISAIYIPLPNDLHKSWAIKSAKNQKHVLCEKPFALTYNDAKEMFQTCQDNNVLVMEAFMYRFNPAILRIKKLIDELVIGDLKFIDFNFSHDLMQYIPDRENYRWKKEAGGGALYDLGVYGINLCNYLLDSAPTQVLKSVAQYDDESEVDQSYYGTLKYKNDVLCNITASFQFFGKHLLLSGTKGSIEVSNIVSMNEIMIQIKDSNHEIIKSGLSPQCNHYKEQVNHFNNCILSGSEPLIKAEETLNVLNTVEKLLHSIVKI